MTTSSQLKKLNNCACFNIRRSTRVITQRYDEVMQPTGLRSTQFSLLAVIAGIGAITVTELAEYLVMDRTTLTRNLVPLEKQGLLKTTAGEDRRTRLISLSQKGKSRLKKAIPYWERAQQSVIDYLGGQRFERFLNELHHVEKLVATSK